MICKQRVWGCDRCLFGVSGMGKTTEYEITSITTPSKPLEASNDFKNWSKGNDFDVFEHPPKNPEGQKQNPVIIIKLSRTKIYDDFKTASYV